MSVFIVSTCSQKKAIKDMCELNMCWATTNNCNKNVVIHKIIHAHTLNKDRFNKNEINMAKTEQKIQILIFSRYIKIKLN